jgi:hypothetical protein
MALSATVTIPTPFSSPLPLFLATVLFHDRYVGLKVEHTAAFIVRDNTVGNDCLSAREKGSTITEPTALTENRRVTGQRAAADHDRATHGIAACENRSTFYHFSRGSVRCMRMLGSPEGLRAWSRSVDLRLEHCLGSRSCRATMTRISRALQQSA